MNRLERAWDRLGHWLGRLGKFGDPALGRYERVILDGMVRLQLSGLMVADGRMVVTEERLIWMLWRFPSNGFASALGCPTRIEIERAVVTSIEVLPRSLLRYGPVWHPVEIRTESGRTYTFLASKDWPRRLKEWAASEPPWVIAGRLSR